MPLLHRARAEILGQDVGAASESSDERLALRLTQVAGDRSLVPALDEPHVRDARCQLVPEPPEIVADTRLLDLDDLGAQLAEQRTTEGRGDERREVQRDQALESSAHRARARESPRLSIARSR